MAPAEADRAALRPLGWARAAFGLVFLARTTPLLHLLHLPFLRPTWPLLGWPDAGWHVSAWGIALPRPAIAALCLARTVAALAFTLGIATRTAGLVAGLAGYLVLSQDVFGYFHHLHLLYLGAILFAISESGSAFALRPERPIAPLQGLALLRAWAASIYAWAALARLRPDWLDGRALDLFHRQGYLHGRLADLLLATPSRCAAAAWAVALLELALVPALLAHRTRRFAVLAALAFHVFNEIVARVDSIGWQMAALLILFAPPYPSQTADSRGQAITA